jgi:hypothetical protein
VTKIGRVLPGGLASLSARAIVTDERTAPSIDCRGVEAGIGDGALRSEDVLPAAAR